LINRNKFPPLNLPPYAAKVRSVNQQIQIFDRFRKKYLTLTPEEWVRQHYANYLVKEKSIPESRLMLESEIKYGKVSKRPDIIVVDPNNLVFLIVECKASEVKLDQSVYDQTITYASVLEPKYLALTNGFKHIYFQFQPETKNFVSIVDIPCLV
jgi:hypothetical protein